MKLFTKTQREMIDEVISEIAVRNPRLLMSYWQSLQREIPKWQIISRFLVWLTERRFVWQVRRTIINLYPRLGFEYELKALYPPILAESLRASEDLNKRLSQKRERLTREKETLVQRIQKAEQAQRLRRLNILETIEKIRKYGQMVSEGETASKRLQKVSGQLDALGKIKLPAKEMPVIPTREPEEVHEKAPP